jgi:maleylpyruvate isomerase
VRFHGYFRSSAAYRCRIAFNLKGVAPNKLASVHLRKGEQRAAEYLKLNPQGLVPTLEASGHVLTQSMAIIE